MRKESSRLRAFKPHMPLLMAGLGACMLGVSPIFVRMTEIGTNAIGCYRLAFALPLAWMWIKLEERANPKSHVKPTGREWYLLCLAGFFFSLDLATWHLSIEMTSIINSAIFNNLTPIFVPLFIWALYSIKPSLIYIASASMAIFGSMILTGSTVSLNPEHFAGDMLAISSAVAYSGYIIIVKNLRDKFNTPTILFWSSFSNLIFLAILSYYMDENIALTTWEDWIGVLGLAILVHILGQGLLTYSMGQLSAAFVSVIMLLGPVVSAGMGWAIYGEAVGWIQTLGCMIVLSSIVTARVDEKIEKAKDASK
jgi:drug/metabolite transporter (DMT)-like permease